MKKNVLMKKRSGDENIGKLIVFAVTIIIAVGVLGTLAYFYNQSRENATQLSILTSTTSSTQDIKDAGFCNDSTTESYIKYTPIKDEYTLTCTGDQQAEIVLENIKAVRGIVGATTGDTDQEAKYQVNK